MPSYTTYDRSIYKAQVVRVYTPAMVFLDVWRDAPLLAGVKFSVNAATTPLRVTLPRSFDSYDLAGAANSRGTIAQGNIVQYWLYGPGLPTTGLLKFQGVIDSYAPQIMESGEENVTVTITPFDSVIADHAIVSAGVPTVTFGTANTPATYIDPVTMFNYWFTNNDPVVAPIVQTYMAPLTLDPTNPTTSGNAYYFAFQTQTLLSVWQTILLMLPPNWFFRINQNKTVTLNVPPTTAQHTFFIGQHLVNPQYSQDWTTLSNIVYFRGVSSWVATAKGTDIATLGARYMLVQDGRVGDANTATAIAQGYLTLYDRPILRVKVRIPDYRGDMQTGLGYDIESLLPGDTCVIQSVKKGTPTTLWDVAVWGTDLWDAGATSPSLGQVVTIYSVDYNFDYVDLELGNAQPSQDKRLWALSQSLVDNQMIQ